jgi:hypothetical protein
MLWRNSRTLPMEAAKAFAAVALAAVSWDGVLTMAGTRTLRHALDYRVPFRAMGDGDMIALMDELLRQLRSVGAEGLMQAAAPNLSAPQRLTAYAMATEIMRSDGPLQAEERLILEHLAGSLAIAPEAVARILEVMDLLHAAVLEEGAPEQAG